MPTTTQLLYANNELEESVKKSIRRKIKLLFDLKLSNREEEARDELQARRRIVTAVSQMINGLRDNMMLLRHNIEYGFFRNLLGGCVVAVVLSAILLIYASITHISSLRTLSLVMLIVYLIPILVAKRVVWWLSRRYSKVLFEQFLSLKS